MTEHARTAEPQESAKPMPMEAFVASIYEIGKNFYHDKHPLHRRMYQGKLSKEEIQGWVANRFYYQTRIPIKDGLILAKSDDKEVRREWIHRIMDHDGDQKSRGGIELWLDLAEAVGLDRKETAGFKLLLPDAKQAIDSYVEFVASHPLFDCVAASLTELFAPVIHKARLDSWPKYYPWVNAEGYAYFKSRLTQAPPDAKWGLDFVKDHAATGDLQRRAREAVFFKCNLLWDLATAIEEGFSAHRRDWKPKLAAKAKLRFDEIDRVHILLLPEKGLKLNEDTAEIVKLCEGTRTRREIIAALQKRFVEKDPREVKIYAMQFLDDFQEKGILA
jgi:pyrroloquinoline-quinone synthase